MIVFGERGTPRSLRGDTEMSRERCRERAVMAIANGRRNLPHLLPGLRQQIISVFQPTPPHEIEYGLAEATFK